MANPFLAVKQVVASLKTTLSPKAHEEAQELLQDAATHFSPKDLSFKPGLDAYATDRFVDATGLRLVIDCSAGLVIARRMWNCEDTLVGGVYCKERQVVGKINSWWLDFKRVLGVRDIGVTRYGTLFVEGLRDKVDAVLPLDSVAAASQMFAQVCGE